MSALQSRFWRRRGVASLGGSASEGSWGELNPWALFNTVKMNGMRMALMDTLIVQVDRALRAVMAAPTESRPMPRAATDVPAMPLSEAERRHAAGLMRVNHVGEVCAQALYQAQSLATTNASLKAGFDQAAQEEADHLAWTAQRLTELQSRPSLLNPLWYAGAFALGLVAGKAGDKLSLGFVVETERQVERHLASHLDTLPVADVQSRAIVEQMRADEARHGETAQGLGASELPGVVKGAMRVAGKVMTGTAYWV